MRWGVVTFPGSNDDHDVLRGPTTCWATRRCRCGTRTATCKGVDCVVLPGGFSYGDYLRCGAMARFSPVMESVAGSPRAGGLVLGICNGFQMLCEAGLLPGALVRNRGLRFVCERVDRARRAHRHAVHQRCTPGERADACRSSTARAATWPTRRRCEQLEANGQVVFRYVDASGRVTPEANPNGSLRQHRRHLQRRSATCSA